MFIYIYIIYLYTFILYQTFSSAQFTTGNLCGVCVCVCVCVCVWVYVCVCVCVHASVEEQIKKPIDCAYFIQKISSASFTTGDLPWFLDLYPNGYKNPNYIALYLHSGQSRSLSTYVYI